MPYYFMRDTPLRQFEEATKHSTKAFDIVPKMWIAFTVPSILPDIPVS